MVTETKILAPVQQMLEELHTQYANVNEGEVASYIPELTRANRDHFGIAVVTLDGHTYTVGECDVPFTIQSISKPFVYGLALEDRGESYVLQRVGLEPTGDAFNAISLDPESGRPSNPMINAGAIATAGMISGDEGDPLDRMLEMFARYAGHELVIDEAVYRSESETGHRNRAIGHLLRNFEILTDDPEGALDLYFRQCSITVTCRDLAMMAATLANHGVNPLTGVQAIDARYVNNVLSIMGTCGMYNYAGEWIYRVGMPAKSGVSGGVMASLAGQVGVGVYSPRLDARGNSVRGVLVCDSLSRVYSLNMLNVPNVSADTIRLNCDATQVASKRQRSPEQRSILDEHGSRIRVYELQGQLNFASVERFSRDVVSRAAEVDYFAIDFKMPARIDHGATELFCDLLTSLLDAGKMIAISDAEHLPGLAERVEGMAMTRVGLDLGENLDRAIEWCEDRLLEAEGASSYRVTAYRAAAGSIARSARPVRELFDARGRAGLQELPGVGERISSTIAEILITGGMSQPARPRGSTQLELELV